ncbi:FAD-dependent monooxygenase [Modestobacter excelsi]|uniref:FAD-dependent monooxygenase n=1 Tax=Modestobacter excelsi TaxID=2213161 RepID=UPI00110CA9C5|nr:FAD-dependent monooxygenase [Modestobacter excelsi]
MPAVNNVLVVGAGAAGATTAILLADDGIASDLVEIKPEVSAPGSGITLQGNALRVLRQLGCSTSASKTASRSRSWWSGCPTRRATIVARVDDIPFGAAADRCATLRLKSDD